MIAGENDVKAYSPENSRWEHTYYSLTNRPVCDPKTQSETSTQHRDPLLDYHCATSNPMDRAVAWVSYARQRCATARDTKDAIVIGFDLLPDSRSVRLMQALAPVEGGSPRRRYHYLDNAWSWLWSFMSEHVGYTDATHTAETDLRL